ncbi:LacI family DNA-binding transcriptional regulator [Pedobacter sp. Leaf176]|uniref:LacI family DNA-binding transcriptional regulator n=1 Tax=Pedobacter sp. Leaf176 TaxID=1736286 RepID=UPI0006F6153D|nr:LacI family DNA-binding transcriptional regulator [Pedobacter sp. Leaf176]KQR70299.1 hypothetical protein ASF92_09935 [Pedobacter sp. Leaf176]
MQNKISIKDIAKITATSITTVSFVINGKAREKNISEEVIKRVEKKVEELGYKPNAFARGLRTGKSKIIGFLVDDISKPFFSRIATSIDQMASLYGYKIIFSSLGHDRNRAKEIFQIFKERQVDGYIIAITAGIEEEIKTLIGVDTPVVFFDRFHPDFEGDFVLSDNYTATKDATNHLLKNGFCNIAFITIESEEQQLIDRLNGYCDAISEVEKQKQVLKLTYNDGQNPTKLIKGFLMKNQSIDAVIFATNYLTMDGLQLLKTRDKEVILNRAVLSFDDFELLSFLTPTVTAVEQPIDGIAENIITLLMKKLQHHGQAGSLQHKTIVIPAKLNVRQSTVPRN